MADIISSLFGLSPIQEEITQKQRERQFGLGQLYGQATVNTNAPVAKQQAYINKQGAQGALGGMAVRGLGSLFGVQDKELKRASDLEAILNQTQQEVGGDPTQLYPLLQQRLADAGYTREAMQVGQVGTELVQKALLNKATIAEKEAQALKATKEKTYLVAGKNVFNASTGNWEKAPEEPIGAFDGSEGTDKLVGVAIATLNDPKSTPEQIEIAKKIYNQILPMKQPAQISQPTPVQITDNKGNVSLVNPITKEITSLGTIGKPSAAYEKLQGTKKKAAQDTDYAINQLEKILSEGTLSQATGSGIGAAVDASIGFFGGSTEGSKAIAKLKPIFDVILKQVPRFEGPQSDKDTASYKEAAGNLANPSTPADEKIIAAQTILDLMKNRKGQFIGETDVGSEGDPLYVQESAPTPVAKKETKVSGQEYKRYIERWKQLSNDPAGQRKLTEAARKAGIVK